MEVCDRPFFLVKAFLPILLSYLCALLASVYEAGVEIV